MAKLSATMLRLALLDFRVDLIHYQIPERDSLIKSIDDVLHEIPENITEVMISPATCKAD